MMDRIEEIRKQLEYDKGFLTREATCHTTHHYGCDCQVQRHLQEKIDLLAEVDRLKGEQKESKRVFNESELKVSLVFIYQELGTHDEEIDAHFGQVEKMFIDLKLQLDRLKGENERMREAIGKLHIHPSMQKAKGIDDNHVIIDADIYADLSDIHLRIKGRP